MIFAHQLYLNFKEDVASAQKVFRRQRTSADGFTYFPAQSLHFPPFSLVGKPPSLHQHLQGRGDPEQLWEGQGSEAGMSGQGTDFSGQEFCCPGNKVAGILQNAGRFLTMNNILLLFKIYMYLILFELIKSSLGLPRWR